MVGFTPSIIEDTVYDICEQVDYLVSSKEYTQAPFMPSKNSLKIWNAATLSSSGMKSSTPTPTILVPPYPSLGLSAAPSITSV